MAYTETDYPTKKALKDALSRGEQVRVYRSGPLFREVADGTVYLEGPHYPKPHTWYASATVKDGIIVGGVK